MSLNVGFSIEIWAIAKVAFMPNLDDFKQIQQEWIKLEIIKRALKGTLPTK